MTEEQNQFKIIDKRSAEYPEAKMLPAVQSPLEIISQAVQRGAGEKELEIIERMFAFDVKVKDQQAKEAHFSAMARFHETVPPILKDKVNNQFKSKYSSVENILNTCRPYLAAQGLYVKFVDPVQTEGSMSLSIVVSHSLGHEETINMTIPIVSAPVGKESGRAAMNPTQAIKATFTYLRGALLEAALGMAGSDATLNNDGNGPGKPEPEYITKGQVTILDKLIKESGADLKKVLGYSTDGKTVATIPAESFKEVKANLETRLTWLKEQAEKKKAPPEREPGEEG